MGSKWPFGSILKQFWQGLGNIWMRLGSSGALTIETCVSCGHFLNTLGVPCCLTLCYRNPRVASLRLAERHNFNKSKTDSNTKRKHIDKITPILGAANRLGGDLICGDLE